MILYRSSIEKSHSIGALSHLGTKRAAIERIDAMFAGYEIRSLDTRRGTFILCDYYGRPIREETAKETVKAFADFAEKFQLMPYEVDIQKPLRLEDCWDEDPIGSGATKIVTEESGLTKNQLLEVREVFSPFEDIIYPEYIFALMTPGQVQKMHNDLQDNQIYAQELEKRRQRSAAIGEDWNMAVANEVVWTALTVRFREWAVNQGYDSFVYKNVGEDKGTDSFVTLTDGQAVSSGGCLSFDRNKYVSRVLPDFSNSIIDKATRANGKIDPRTGGLKITEVYWGDQNPLEFWS